MTRFSRAYASTLAAQQDARRQAESRSQEAAKRKPAAEPPSGEPPGKRSSKFGNVKTGVYDSKREAQRAAKLQAMQAAGKIRNLREKVTYLLIPKQDGERQCTYTADFVYEENGETVVEDVKGFPNDRWPIKRKLMLFLHQIRVKVV